MEWVSGIKRNHCPESNGMGVRDGLEYAAGVRVAEIGREFGLEKYSSVSSIVMRTEQLISQNKHLKKRLEKVRSMLRKSQAKT